MALLWYFKKSLQIALTQNGPQSQAHECCIARAASLGAPARTMGPHRGRRAGCWVTLAFSGAPWPHFPQTRRALPAQPHSPSVTSQEFIGRSGFPVSLNKGMGPVTSFQCLPHRISRDFQALKMSCRSQRRGTQEGRMSLDFCQKLLY